MDQPLLILLDVKQQVRALRNMRKHTPKLRESTEEIIEQLVIRAQVKNEAYNGVLKYVAEVKHGQCQVVGHRALEKVTMAIGDLGVKIIEHLDHMKFFDIEDPMPYYYDGLNLDGVVIHREQTINER